MKPLHLATFFLISCAAPAAAEISTTHFFTNDMIGDGNDRWRSASYTRFYSLTGDKTFDVPLDFRLRAEIISPWNDADLAAGGDRPYAGMIGAGVFATDRVGLADYTIGGEILAVGEQTGVANLQEAFHDLFGLDGYTPDQDGAAELSDEITGMISGEYAMNYFLGEKGAVRPYVMVQYGYENFLRVGADAIWGNFSFSERYARDPVTGFIQPSSQNKADHLQGFNIIAGADYTTVTHSAFFPDEHNAVLEPARFRARLGFQGKIGPASLFYGATYLTEEFQQQEEGQALGTLSVELPF